MPALFAEPARWRALPFGCTGPVPSTEAAYRARVEKSDSLVTNPPVILLGGNDNALSVARALGRRSIPVFALNPANVDVVHSRYVKRIPTAPRADLAEAARDFFGGPDSRELEGAVLLALSDDAIVYLSKHRTELSRRFLLDLSNPEAALRMLDKYATYSAAQAAGVATPKFWPVDSLIDLRSVGDQLVFPLIVKPVLSHVFQQQYGSKFIVADDYDAVADAVAAVESSGTAAMLVERVPDPIRCCVATTATSTSVAIRSSISQSASSAETLPAWALPRTM